MAEESVAQPRRTQRLSRAQMEQFLREKIKHGERVSKNINVLHEEQLSLGERLADRMADIAGSWTFILSFLAIIAVWVLVNTAVFLTNGWDPYPFILLNLILSFMAGLQAPIIMMSQNRQEAKDRLRAEHDYEVNLKAEMEIEQLHLKMDALREKQWSELVEMQQRQIALLESQLALLQEMKAGGETKTAGAG
ncbi:MAG: DUF1003 domain-containing protein [Chloroflexota bacterium]